MFILLIFGDDLYNRDHLKILEKFPPAFVITSLGSPEEVIRRLKPLGVKKDLSFI